MWTAQHAEFFHVRPWEMGECSPHELRLMARRLTELRQQQEVG